MNNISYKHLCCSFVFAVSMIAPTPSSAQNMLSNNWASFTYPGQSNTIYVVSYTGAFSDLRIALGDGGYNSWWNHQDKATQAANALGPTLGPGGGVGLQFAYNTNGFGVVNSMLWQQGTTSSVNNPVGFGTSYAVQPIPGLNITTNGEPYNSIYPSSWLGGPLNTEFNGGTLQIVSPACQGNSNCLNRPGFVGGPNS